MMNVNENDFYLIPFESVIMRIHLLIISEKKHSIFQKCFQTNYYILLKTKPNVRIFFVDSEGDYLYGSKSIF